MRIDLQPLKYAIAAFEINQTDDTASEINYEALQVYSQLCNLLTRQMVVEPIHRSLDDFSAPNKDELSEMAREASAVITLAQTALSSPEHSTETIRNTLESINLRLGILSEICEGTVESARELLKTNLASQQ